jgi:hypothetical protein
MTVEERFWSHVDRRGDDECWDWTASLNNMGYGKFANTSAHRWAYIHFVADPGELEVRHTCDRPICVNFVSHLIPGTHTDNMADMWERGRGGGGEHKGVVLGRGPKLTLEEVNEIRRLYTGAYGQQKALGIQFSVSTSHIRKIVKGRLWTE